MVADDLVEFLASAPEPAGKALVQLGAELLGDALVRGVADQYVPEAEGVLDRFVRADQFLADEGRELRPGGPTPVGSQLSERLPLELEADDGGALEYLPLLLRERIEPCREKRLNRRGHTLRVASFREHREQLLDEEWIPRSNLADPGSGIDGQLGVTDELRDQLVRLGRRERLERDRLRLQAPTPRRADVDQIGTREAQQQQRRVASPVHEMLQEVEQGRLGPMDVLDDERDRLLACATLERLPDRPEDVLRCDFRKRGGELVLGVGLAEDLDEWPVGDALAIGEAATGQDARLVGQHRDELEGKPRLADPRRPEDGDEPAASLGNGAVEGGAHLRELVAASNERCVESPAEGGRTLDHSQQAVRDDGLRLPLERQRLDRLDVDRPAGKASRLLTDQDLARLRSLLETGGDVDGVARRQPLVSADDDLSRIDAGAELQ